MGVGSSERSKRSKRSVSRRDFLKLAGTGVMSLLIKPLIVIDQYYLEPDFDKNKNKDIENGYRYVCDIGGIEFSLKDKYREQYLKFVERYPEVSVDELNRVTKINCLRGEVIHVLNFSNYEIMEVEQMIELYETWIQLALLRRHYSYESYEKGISMVTMGSDNPADIIIGIVNNRNVYGREHQRTQSYKWDQPNIINVRIPDSHSDVKSITKDFNKIAISMLATELAQVTTSVIAIKNGEGGKVENAMEYSPICQEVYANSLGLATLMKSQGYGVFNYAEQCKRIYFDGGDGVKLPMIRLSDDDYRKIPILRMELLVLR